MLKVNNVEQIYHFHWGDKGTPEFYWKYIGRIADEIGKDLKQNSTIFVVQTKEKFGQCRVYVDFANFDLLVKQFRKLNPRTDIGEDQYNQLTDEQEKAKILDACVYRKVYMKYKKLYPQYWINSIKGAADYPEFLFESAAEYNKNISKKNINPLDKKCLEACHNLYLGGDK